jgi:hypothetical protein
MMMSNWTPERKAQAILRAAGVMILLLGVYLLTETLGLTISALTALLDREWFGLAANLGTLCIILPLTCLCLYAGWKVVRNPERANPRLLLMAIFIPLFFILSGLGQSVFFDGHGLSSAREFLRPWSKLYSFAVMLFCTLLYYASCRWLRRWGAFTKTQRATLFVPPSIQLCGLIGFLFISAAQEFINQYYVSRHGIDAPALLWLGLLVFAYWLYRFLYLALASYLAAPNLSITLHSNESTSAP